ncbi:hypothetical protein [Nostoc sp.]|uniref:hypothetical protein n=1 Tax=Nostoc sp. TaxID=1180 RepID=UPI002FFA2B30
MTTRESFGHALRTHRLMRDNKIAIALSAMALVLRAISFAARNQLLLLRSYFGFDWEAIPLVGFANAIDFRTNSATAINGFAVIITPLNPPLERGETRNTVPSLFQGGKLENPVPSLFQHITEQRSKYSSL